MLLNLITGVFTAIFPALVLANDVIPACPNGVCPGLGHAFYLPETNLLDAKSNSGGRAVFKNVGPGGCATLVDIGAHCLLTR